MLHFISLWTSAPSFTCPKPSMHRIWCVWKSPRMVRLVLIKSLLKVTVDGVLSDQFGIDLGVPQGSCLGPLLFVIYSSKLLNIVNKHLPNVHAYTADTIYLASKGNCCCVIYTILCPWYVQNWMMMDRLKINPDKTEILILGTRQQLEKAIYYFTPCCWWISNISPSTKVKNLGSWFDSNLDIVSHVNNICSLSFYYIYNRRRIRKYLSHQTANYLLSMRILPVNWTTATAYYMAFLLFTLINFKEFKMLLLDW